MFENLVIEAINANSMAKNTSTVGILISGIISPFYQSCFTLIALLSSSHKNYEIISMPEVHSCQIWNQLVDSQEPTVVEPASPRHTHLVKKCPLTIQKTSAP